MVSRTQTSPSSATTFGQLSAASTRRPSILNAGNKFIALTGFVFVLLVVDQAAPGTAILFGIVLLVAAYFAVHSNQRR